MVLYSILVFAHVAANIIGVGGATMSDALFFRSIKDKKISEDEYALLKQAGMVIWAALGVLVLSGILLVLREHFILGGSERLSKGFFHMKMFLVLAIAINGVVFHKKVLPFMKANTGVDMRKKLFVKHYWLFTSTGTISILSWWSIVLLVFTQPQMDFLSLLIAYTVVLLIGVLVAYALFTHALKQK